MRVTLVHTSGIRKRVKIGFSWTTLFFGILVPIFRGDLRNAARYAILGLLTIGLYWIFAPFGYNKRYMETLLEKGYSREH